MLSASEALGRSVTLRASVDTGNSLCDPLSGEPVILADREALASVLPESVLYLSPENFAASLSAPGMRGKVRLIPAAGAVGEGLMTLIVPDEAVIEEGRKRIAVRAKIGLGNVKYGDGECRALLPPTLCGRV